MVTDPASPLGQPEPHGFIYCGFYGDKPQKLPFYRQTPRRRAAADTLLTAAEAILDHPDVRSVRVFRAHLVPPLLGRPRHDLAMLVRTDRVEDLTRVRQDLSDLCRSEKLRALNGHEIMSGVNAARIGETEGDPDATFLLNHFTTSGDSDPLKVWLGLTEWYVSTIGVDNSTALRPIEEDSEFALVNYVRLPRRALAFLLDQLLRPSFHRMVAGSLKANGMRALPGFYRMIR